MPSLFLIYSTNDNKNNNNNRINRFLPLNLLLSSSSRGINHKKRIIQVYFTIDISDYNARSEEPIAAPSHSRDIVGQRDSCTLELVSRFERNSRLSALESAAILGGRAVSIPVEPIFNGFITPAPSIEFLFLSKASFRARALARVCLCAFACRFF